MDERRIEEMMDQAAELVKRSDSPWYRINHLMAHARISLKRGKIEEAIENLSEARALYREMGLEDGTGELRSIEEELGEQGG
ncbi:MAG: hypothetical protein ABIE47_12240 [Pseudomonadota bacterium]